MMFQYFFFFIIHPRNFLEPQQTLFDRFNCIPLLSIAAVECSLKNFFLHLFFHFSFWLFAAATASSVDEQHGLRIHWDKYVL